MAFNFRPNRASGPGIQDWEKMFYQGLENSFGSPPSGEPMGNAIRRLVNETQGAKLPLMQFAQPGPQQAADQPPTFESRLDYYKNRWRNMAPTATAFSPNMSFDGINKIGSAQEYEAYMDQQAIRKAQADMDSFDKIAMGRAAGGDMAYWGDYTFNVPGKFMDQRAFGFGGSRPIFRTV